MRADRPITIAGFRFTESEWRALDPAERAAILEALRPAMAIADRPALLRRAALRRAA